MFGECEPVDRDELGDAAPDEHCEGGVGREELSVRIDDEAGDGRTLERRQESALGRLLRRGPFEDLGDVVEDRRGTLDDSFVVVDGVGVDAQPCEAAVGAADPHCLVAYLPALYSASCAGWVSIGHGAAVGMDRLKQRVRRTG